MLLGNMQAKIYPHIPIKAENNQELIEAKKVIYFMNHNLDDEVETLEEGEIAYIYILESDIKTAKCRVYIRNTKINAEDVSISLEAWFRLNFIGRKTIKDIRKSYRKMPLV